MPGNVGAISGAGTGGIAQLADGSFVGWGSVYQDWGVSRVRSFLPR